MKMDMADRKALPSKDFAVPSKAPGSGSYPINDKSHAKNALARSSGKPVAAQVKAKVAAKFPGIGKDPAEPDADDSSNPKVRASAQGDPAEPDQDDESTARAKRVKAFESKHGDSSY